MKKTLFSLAILVALTLSACGGGAAAAPPPAQETGGTETAGGDAPEAGVFLINNTSSQQICFAYVSPHSEATWGPDQLGANTIPPGESFAWTAGVGYWDVKLEDCQHNVLFENTDGFDINSGGTILTIHD